MVRNLCCLLYTQCLRYNICSTWLLDIRISTCCTSDQSLLFSKFKKYYIALNYTKDFLNIGTPLVLFQVQIELYQNTQPSTLVTIKQINFKIGASSNRLCSLNCFVSASIDQILTVYRNITAVTYVINLEYVTSYSLIHVASLPLQLPLF